MININFKNSKNTILKFFSKKIGNFFIALFPLFYLTACSIDTKKQLQSEQKIHSELNLQANDSTNSTQNLELEKSKNSSLKNSIKENQIPIVGADRDSHGCIGSAGYQWCRRLNKCIRPWELAVQSKVDNNANEIKKICD